jgi:hypothetical protein
VVVVTKEQSPCSFQQKKLLSITFNEPYYYYYHCTLQTYHSHTADICDELPLDHLPEGLGQTTGVVGTHAVRGTGNRKEMRASSNRGQPPACGSEEVATGGTESRGKSTTPKGGGRIDRL